MGDFNRNELKVTQMALRKKVLYTFLWTFVTGRFSTGLFVSLAVISGGIISGRTGIDVYLSVSVCIFIILVIRPTQRFRKLRRRLGHYFI